MKSSGKKEWAWSYSKYSCYKKCPRQYKFKYIDKIKEPQSPALANGIRVHELGENYLLDKIKRVPKEYIHFSDDLKYCKENGATPEETFTFTKNWKGTTSWVANNAWLRLKIDMCLDLNKSGTRIKITDFKTGKVRKGEYSSQVDLYAVAKFTTNKKIKEIVPDFWFLDHGVVLVNENDNTIKEYYLSKDLVAMQKQWLHRIKPMKNDDIFAPKPSWLCAYCNFKMCKFNKNQS